MITMKRIYIVSLDDEVPLSPQVIDNIKVLCSLVYDEIQGIEYETGQKILHRDAFIRYNELREKKEKDGYTHRFINDTPETGEFEPFMLNDRSFAFTINDDLIGAKEIEDIIYMDRIYYKSPGKFSIDSVTYEEDNKNKNRLIAIRKILNKETEQKEAKKIKTRVKSIIPLIGL